LKRAKPAFIFMIRHSIEVPDPWIHFFEGAHPSDFKLLVHDSALHSLGQDLPNFFLNHLVERRDTFWCHLTKAQFSLAEEALQDPDVSHIIWLSGDSIPLKSLDYVRLQLQTDLEVSRFCVDKPHGRAQMWSAISRKHIQSLISMQSQLFTFFEKWQTACEDEDMYWVPLKLMGFEKDLRDQCLMWTDWQRSLGVGGFHNEKSDMLGEPLVLRGLKHNIEGGGMHPWTLSTVPRQGIMKLIGDADTWFARKFVELSTTAGGGVYDEERDFVGTLSDFLIHNVNYGGQADVIFAKGGDQDNSTEAKSLQEPLSTRTPIKSEDMASAHFLRRSENSTRKVNTMRKMTHRQNSTEAKSLQKSLSIRTPLNSEDIVSAHFIRRSEHSSRKVSTRRNMTHRRNFTEAKPLQKSLSTSTPLKSEDIAPAHFFRRSEHSSRKVDTMRKMTHRRNSKEAKSLQKSLSTSTPRKSEDIASAHLVPKSEHTPRNVKTRRKVTHRRKSADNSAQVTVPSVTKGSGKETMVAKSVAGNSNSSRSIDDALSNTLASLRHSHQEVRASR